MMLRLTPLLLVICLALGSVSCQYEIGKFLLLILYFIV